MISEVNPKVKIHNPYRRLEKKIKIGKHLPEKELLLLYQQLVKASAIFNKRYRQKQGYKIIISREDIVNTLSLIRPIAFPESMLSESSRKFYASLLLIMKEKTIMTRGEISSILNCHPQKAWRHIISLTHAGYLNIAMKGKSGIHYYKLHD